MLEMCQPGHVHAGSMSSKQISSAYSVSSERSALYLPCIMNHQPPSGNAQHKQSDTENSHERESPCHKLVSGSMARQIARVYVKVYESKPQLLSTEQSLRASQLATDPLSNLQERVISGCHHSY